ncbi:MAG: sigma-54-dependent Fis family transcriptional regulator [Candidatus Aureabacteria bacterium]|nr:sigma-54-dependent Fis family transcriptional regulator [Candidatus Auribacterota bacterium]
MKEKIDQRILIVHEKQPISSYVAARLKSWGCKVDTTASGYTAMEKIGYYSYFAVFISSTLPLTNYRDLIKRIQRDYAGLYVVVLDSENKLTETEVKECNLDFYIPDPMDDHLLSSVLSEMAGRRPDLEKYFENIPLVTFDFERMVGKHPKMIELYKIMKKLSLSSVTVLILGESGTGKELTARAIHYSGERKNGPFVAVSCAAIPENLLESELFGHEKGAFTGAVNQKIGKFEQAHRGTIFLDEIAEMSPSLQAKLLRVLEENEFQRVGGTEKTKVDVRIISATNKDLWKLAQEGVFRQDLYYRLSAFPLHLPPLRERKTDIPFIAGHFIKKHHKRAGKDLCRIDKDALEILKEFTWKGNVRELENVIERSLVMCEDNIIRVKDLPDYLLEVGRQEKEHTEDVLVNIKPIEEIEKEAMIKALQKTSGNQSQAARQLKMNLITFYRKIKKYNIPVKEIKS